MNKLAPLAIVATLGSVSFEVGTYAAENPRKLSGSQIRQKLAGMQLADDARRLRPRWQAEKLFGWKQES